MKTTDVIIVGAGAAGLMAAYSLAKAGKTVTVLEARSRIGGRIHTIAGQGFTRPVELGAEFIHGNLSVTLGLIKEAGIVITGVDFEMWQHHDNSFEQNDTFVEGWEELLEKLNGLQEDMPLHDFLEENFAYKKFRKMREQVENYVSGYDTADSRDASAFALREEWNHENLDAQYRIEGGYGKLMDYLAGFCHTTGNEILLNITVTEVIWQKEHVKITDESGNVYQAAKVIIALPLGVLQAKRIRFNPPIQAFAEAIADIGFGSVIKILLEFDETFWESDWVSRQFGINLSTMGFLFTNEEIPTYWTQAPQHSRLLTGWLGGPPAYHKKDRSDEELLQMALASLSNVFKIGEPELRARLVAWRVANWTADPYTRGSYAYGKVGSAQARKLLQQPVDDTLYFAGEYLYKGSAMGTVEAALTSGRDAARLIDDGKATP